MVCSILVVGGGSAGKRHAGNFASLGCSVAVVDTREDRRAECKAKGFETFPSITDAVSAKKFLGAVVAVPPAYHVLAAQELADFGINVLIEKPPSHSWDGVEKLLKTVKDKNLKVMVGYTHRFWRPLIEFKKLLPGIGKVLSVDAVYSEHGDDRHAVFGETAKDFFVGHKQLGGGALFEDSHPIDFVRWLFGDPVSVVALNTRVSGVGADADDVAELLITMKECICRVHVDLYGRPHQKRLEAIGSEGTLRWDFYDNKVVLIRKGEKLNELQEESFIFKNDRNEMFVDEEKHFLDCILNNKQLLYPLEEGFRTLDLLLAAKKSSESGISVKMPYLFK